MGYYTHSISYYRSYMDYMVILFVASYSDPCVLLASTVISSKRKVRFRLAGLRNGTQSFCFAVYGLGVGGRLLRLGKLEHASKSTATLNPKP